MGSWNKIESGLVPANDKIEFNVNSLGKFALKIPEYLPSDFQEVEYIQTTGTQYIITNYTHTVSSGAKAVIESTLMGGSNLKYILGSQYTLSSLYPYFSMELTSNKFSFEYGTGVTSKFGTANINTKYEMSMNYLNNGKIIANNTTYVTSGVSFNTGQYPIVINGDYINGSIERIGYYKLYLIELTEDTNIIHKYIPCYCITNVTAYQGLIQTTANAGTIGMYDIIENKFYINSGTGTFTKGPDIN